MSEILFRSSCPSITCEDNTIYRWYHDGCPSSSKEYLSWDAEIRCEYCGKKWDFFNSIFNCNRSSNSYQFGTHSLKTALNIATNMYMMKTNDMTADFLLKLKYSLIEQEKRYN